MKKKDAIQNLRLYSDLPETHEDFKLDLWTGGDYSKYKKRPYLKRVGGRYVDGGGEIDNGYKFFIYDYKSSKVLDILKNSNYLEVVEIFSTTSPTLNKGRIVYAYEQAKK